MALFPPPIIDKQNKWCTELRSPGGIRWGEVAQSFPTLCDPMDCSLQAFSVHGILQARILEWITVSFSRGSSRPRDRTQVSRIGGRCFNLWATREAQIYWVRNHCSSMLLIHTTAADQARVQRPRVNGLRAFKSVLRVLCWTPPVH